MDLAYFRENYRLIAIDLSKPIKLKDPQKSNFIGKLEDQNNEATISSLKNRKKLLLNFYKILWTSYKNGNAKDFKFFKQFWKWIFKICNKKMVRYWQRNIWYLLSSKSNKAFSKVIRINSLWVCDYSDAYNLVTGNIVVAVGDADTKAAFKCFAPFGKCRTEIINDNVIDEAEHINTAMPIYNLIEYRDNYSDTSGSLWHFKRDEIEGNVNLTVNAEYIPNNCSSFKCKSSLITDKNGVKTAAPLK